jgi:hypothetical protein
MTLHIDYDHSCSNCKAHYIPYDENVPCPNCKIVEEERFDFIPEAVMSMVFNKVDDGFFTPVAWWIGSFADHILMLLFQLFDSYESQQDNKLQIEDFASTWLSDIDWEDHPYLQDHVYSIVMRVAKELYESDS